MMRKNQNNYQLTRNQPTTNTQNSRTLQIDRFRYMQAADSRVRRFYIPGIQKQNTLRDTNLSRLLPNYTQQFHVKSTSSTNQQTHPKTSTDNLHALRLQSQILQLQKTLDQQQFQLQTLTQQASHFMKLCQQQKQILISLNIQGMKSQYQQQIDQLLIQRSKVQEIILQLQDDYGQVYRKQQIQLNIMRQRNIEIAKQIQIQLQRKKSILTLLSTKDKQLHILQIDLRQSQERIDQLRNIQRKLTIALRQLQMIKCKSNIKKQNISIYKPTTQVIIQQVSPRNQDNYQSPIKRQNKKNISLEKNNGKNKFRYQYQS